MQITCVEIRYLQIINGASCRDCPAIWCHDGEVNRAVRRFEVGPGQIMLIAESLTIVDKISNEVSKPI